ncbi:DUF7315 family membrane protein [Halococcus agarilyticus]|uniref:DUF7315 family membrane protein n=1 Tax=Halococcus agarilyticus TaxID=1232219 RepID=UPI0006782C8A|nr:hypothetical protein [Halococcus agarilyticus]
MGSDAGSGTEADGDDDGRRGGREVVVPLRTYKAVTVFSTLIAIVSVLLGFAFLDAATAEAGPLPVLFDLLDVPLPFGPDAAGLVLVLLGLALIGLGAAVYVLGTRFRTTGMRNAQDDSDEPSGNE